jgi:hypothetical protein
MLFWLLGFLVVSAAPEPDPVIVDHRGALADLARTKERLLTWRERADRRGREASRSCLDHKLTMLGALETILVRANRDVEAAIDTEDAARTATGMLTIRKAKDQVAQYQVDAARCYRL